MPYHKRPLRACACRHCGQPFAAAHKSRLYCSSSCNTLAWRARRALAGPAPQPLAPALVPAPTPALPGAAELAFTWQTVGVIAAGTAVGQLALQAGAALFHSVTKPAAETDPAAWLPPALRAGRGPAVLAHFPEAPRPVLLEQFVHEGVLLCYHRAAGRLFYPLATGVLLPVPTAANLGMLVEAARAAQMDAMVRRHVPGFAAPADALPAPPSLARLEPLR